MATPDGRAPPSPGDSDTNPGLDVADSRDENTGATDVSPLARKREEPVGRRATGAIPAQGIPPRRATGAIPAQGAPPRRATGAIPAQRAAPQTDDTNPNAELPKRAPESPPAPVARRATTGIPAQGRVPSLLDVPTDAGSRTALSRDERRALERAAEPPRALGTTVDQRPLAVDEAPAPQGTSVDQRPLSVDVGTAPWGTTVDQQALPPGPSPLGTTVDHRALELPEVTPPNEPLPGGRHGAATDGREVTPPAEPLSRRPAPRAAPRPEPDEVENTPQLSPMPTTRARGGSEDRPNLLDESTRIGALPEAPPQKRVEHLETSMLPEVDDPEVNLAPRPVSKPGPPVPDDEDAGLPTAALSRAEIGLGAERAPAPPEPRKPAPRKTSDANRAVNDAKPRKRAASPPQPAVRVESSAGRLRNESELSRMIRVEAMRNSGASKYGFQLAIGLVMVLLGAGVFAAFVLHGDRPPREALQLAYPYGFTGGRMPNGRAAPPVSEITFEYESSVECGDSVCARYNAHTTDDAFHLTMDLRKDAQGDWKLANSP
jgi:hypothetical protein